MTLQSGLSIHVSSNLKFLFLLLGSPFNWRIIGVWSDPSANSFTQMVSRKLVAQFELIRTQSNLSYTFSSPRLLFDQVNSCPFAPRSSIWISSIIELKASINLYDFLLLSFFFHDGNLWRWSPQGTSRCSSVLSQNVEENPIESVSNWNMDPHKST